MKKETKYRVGVSTSLILLFIAAICDLTGLIPLVEDVLTPLYWVFASFILRRHGVPIFNGRKLAVIAIDVLVGLIPAIQAFPQIVLGIAAVLLIIRAEDKLGLKLINGKAGTLNTNAASQALNQMGVRRPNNRPTPLNEGGIRQPRKEEDNDDSDALPA